MRISYMYTMNYHHPHFFLQSSHIPSWPSQPHVCLSLSLCFDNQLSPRNSHMCAYVWVVPLVEHWIPTSEDTLERECLSPPTPPGISCQLPIAPHRVAGPRKYLPILRHCFAWFSWKYFLRYFSLWNWWFNTREIYLIFYYLFCIWIYTYV